MKKETIKLSIIPEELKEHATIDKDSIVKLDHLSKVLSASVILKHAKNLKKDFKEERPKVRKFSS